ncbi:hypothetical protein GOODEAATRI_024097 [Goodea atripinnis]|uniref:Uncharacterized protein n=1 Tax=Goodea atripinnis TaxID=208336 RepID=A0ABV0P7D1_9TELE
MDRAEAENLTEKESKNDRVKEEELGVSVSSPAPDYKPDKDDAEIAEVNKDVSASELGNVVETKTPSPNAETAMPELPKDQLEEDHSDEFPFNMSDFVTVDELGDVTDLPDLAVPMETSDKRDAAPQTEQQEVYKDTSGETTVTQEAESDEKVPESKHVSSQTPQTLNSLESDIMLASSPDAEPISSSPAVPAQSTSNSPAGAATAESDERKNFLEHLWRLMQNIYTSWFVFLQVWSTCSQRLASSVSNDSLQLVLPTIQPRAQHYLHTAQARLKQQHRKSDAEEAEAKAGSKLAQLITKSNALRRPSREKSAELKNIEEEILAKEEELRLM